MTTNYVEYRVWGLGFRVGGLVWGLGSLSPMLESQREKRMEMQQSRGICRSG